MSSPLRRAAVLTAVGLLAIIAVLGALVLAFQFNFHHFAPAATYPPPRSAREAQRQDLDYFAKVIALDRAFSPAARAAAAKRIAALESVPEAAPSPEFQVALMQLMASADNGHSRMDATADQGTRVLPLRVSSFAGGF